MAKQEQPSYRKRILDTRGAAQRITLDLLRRPGASRRLRWRIAGMASAAALLAAGPYFFRGGEKFYENGGVSRAHTIFEKNCANCHTAKFSRVADAACQRCHDGPVHHANAIGTLRCGECHVEHRGDFSLAAVGDLRCTGCHGDLAAHARNLTLRAERITAFRSGAHPDFAAASQPDSRPLKLNHAKHMALTAQANRNLAGRLPMKCADCHVTDRASLTGDLLPVMFEQNCRACHSRELEFDVFQLLGRKATPAPHAKDPRAIHDFIVQAYEDLYAASPAVLQQPLERDFQPAANKAAWLAAVVKRSEEFLFGKKCRYCHEYADPRGGYPAVRKVNPIRGRYQPDQSAGGNWLPHSVFQHRAHRAVTCDSCHAAARRSTETKDVLIPVMSSCLPCHGSTGTAQDRCAQCHLYHDKSKELDRDRRPVEELASFRRKGHGFGDTR